MRLFYIGKAVATCLWVSNRYATRQRRNQAPGINWLDARNACIRLSRTKSSLPPKSRMPKKMVLLKALANRLIRITAGTWLTLITAHRPNTRPYDGYPRL